MLVELHLLQNFAPSNLNRDDTGAPKDCEFGGYRRARISSQCLKRAVREHFRTSDLLPLERLAVRTKRLVDDLADRLETEGKDREQARAVVEAALNGVGLKVVVPAGRPEEHLTQYLVFAGRKEIDALAAACVDHWESLVQVAGIPANGAPPAAGAARPSARDAKKAAKASVPKHVNDAFLGALNGGKAVDLALFGRMLADLPDKNVDAACQVAHAISTNKVGVEFDFYTAVDDLRPGDTTGADMLGTVEFNSACFYRYSNLDTEQLLGEKSLQGDVELARSALASFVRASVAAIPTGKQNSMAAQNPPSLVFAVVRDRGLWSLANAFADPVRPNGQGDLVNRSAAALDEYWGRLAGMYGERGVQGKWVATLHPEALRHLTGNTVDSVEHLVQEVVAAAMDVAGTGNSAA